MANGEKAERDPAVKQRVSQLREYLEQRWNDRFFEPDEGVRILHQTDRPDEIKGIPTEQVHLILAEPATTFGVDDSRMLAKIATNEVLAGAFYDLILFKYVIGKAEYYEAWVKQFRDVMKNIAKIRKLIDRASFDLHDCVTYLRNPPDQKAGKSWKTDNSPKMSVPKWDGAGFLMNLAAKTHAATMMTVSQSMKTLEEVEKEIDSEAETILALIRSVRVKKGRPLGMHTLYILLNYLIVGEILSKSNVAPSGIESGLVSYFFRHQEMHGLDGKSEKQIARIVSNTLNNHMASLSPPAKEPESDAAATRQRPLAAALKNSLNRFPNGAWLLI